MENMHARKLLPAAIAIGSIQQKHAILECRNLFFLYFQTSMSLRHKPFDGSLKDILPGQLLALKDVREGWHVEYKSALIEPKKLAKSLASFANQYGGWLCLGVQEKAKELVADSFPGIDDREVAVACENIKNASKDLLNPEVFYDYRVFKGPIKEIDLPAHIPLSRIDLSCEQQLRPDSRRNALPKKWRAAASITSYTSTFFSR